MTITHEQYQQAMETVRVAMRSGAEPSATECCIEQYVQQLLMTIKYGPPTSRAEKRCPTCGSDQPKYHLLDVGADRRVHQFQADVPCPDPWHGETP